MKIAPDRRQPPESWLDQVDDFGPDWAIFHERKTAMLKGWRTLILAGGTALLGVASQMDWTSVLAGPYAGWIVMGIGVASAVLRTVTNTPVGQK